MAVAPASDVEEAYFLDYNNHLPVHSNQIFDSGCIKPTFKL